MQIALVVAIRSLSGAVDDRPVGHVAPQIVHVFGQLFDSVLSRDGDEAFKIGLAGDVAQLCGVAAAERNLAARVNHTAAEIEVLVNHQHRGAKIARPDGARQAEAAAAEDDHVVDIIPLDVLPARIGFSLRRNGGAGQGGCAHASSSAGLEEFAPIQALSFKG